jgi:hypothetical protein
MLIFNISFPDLINFLTLWIILKEGFGDRRPKDRVTEQIILVFTLTLCKTLTQGHVSVCDKYLQSPHVSVIKNIYIATG